ncbi:L-glyceraldehyde 3-phosphate reductase [compost metagenome]
MKNPDFIVMLQLVINDVKAVIQHLHLLLDSGLVLLQQVMEETLAQGVLTGKYKPGQAVPEGSRASNSQTNGVINSYLREDVLACTAKLADLAAELGVTLSRFALAWMLRQPNVISAIIGSSRPAQIEENLQAVGLVLTEEILARTEAILAEVRDFAPLR